MRVPRASRTWRAPGVVEQIQQIGGWTGAEVDVQYQVDGCSPTLTSVARCMDEESDLLV